MKYVRSLAPGGMSLALVLILAACGQAVANPPSASPIPSTPASPSDSPSPEPTVVPTPTVKPSAPSAPTAPTTPPAPTPVPTPKPIQVVKHDLPMIGVATVDGVNVRTLPSIQAPLISGERHDLSKVPNIRLAKGDQVFVTVGPVFADGYSWYQVASSLPQDIYWEFGWVAGEYLQRLSDVPVYNPIIIDMHGVGTGAAASADVPGGLPLTIDLAATPKPGAEACELSAVLTGTDGVAVEIAAWDLTDVRVLRMAGFEYPELWQEAAGKATLQVKTDCSFAASITLPQA